MNLVVKVDGQARSISGVTPSTTTTQLVYALAHSINQKGRFLLIAQLGDSGEEERRLAPSASPLLFIERYKAEGLKISLELRRLEEPTSAHSSQRNSHHFTSLIAQYSSPSLNSITSIPSSSSPSMGSVENSSRLRMNQALGSDRSSGSTPTNPSPSSNNSTIRSSGKPPPPAYNVVLVEKFNSLTRDRGVTNSNRVNESSLDSLEKALLERRFTETQLTDLIQSQGEKQARQREEISKLEAMPASDIELELLQLRKQHNNLQTVLDSLRNCNWPERLEHERVESRRLQTAIDAVQTAIGKRRRELNGVLEAQRSLELKYAMEAQRHLPIGGATP